MELQQYTPISLLYKDQYYSDKLCKHKGTDEFVLIKRIKKKQIQSRNLNQNINSESKLFKQLESLKLLSQFQNQLYFYMIFQFENNTVSLADMLRCHTFDQRTIKSIMVQLIVYLEQLHKLKYYHNNLNPNVIRVNRNGNIFVTSLFYAKQIELKRRDKFDIFYLQQYHPYLALEITQAYSQQNFTVDFWPLGLILHQLYTNELPFKVTQKNRNSLINIDNSNIPKQALDLIKKLLRRNYQRIGRNGIQELKDHSYFKDTNWLTTTTFEIRQKILTKTVQEQVWEQMYYYHIESTRMKDLLCFPSFKSIEQNKECLQNSGNKIINLSVLELTEIMPLESLRKNNLKQRLLEPNTLYLKLAKTRNKQNIEP